MENVLQAARSSIETKTEILTEFLKSIHEKELLQSAISSLRIQHDQIISEYQKIHEIRQIKKKIRLIKTARQLPSQDSTQLKKTKIFVDDKMSFESYRNLAPNRNSTPKTDKKRGLHEVMNNQDKLKKRRQVY